MSLCYTMDTMLAVVRNPKAKELIPPHMWIQLVTVGLLWEGWAEVFVAEYRRTQG